MKWKASPSPYRYWTLRCSTRARGQRVPAWKVRSTMSPRRTFWSFIRTWADPRAILMCVQSRTFISCPSSSMITPFLMSPVSIMPRSPSLPGTFGVGLRDVGLLPDQVLGEVMGAVAHSAGACSHEVVVAARGVRRGDPRDRGDARRGDRRRRQALDQVRLVPGQCL